MLLDTGLKTTPAEIHSPRLQLLDTWQIMVQLQVATLVILKRKCWVSAVKRNAHTVAKSWVSSHLIPNWSSFCWRWLLLIFELCKLAWNNFERKSLCSLVGSCLFQKNVWGPWKGIFFVTSISHPQWKFSMPFLATGPDLTPIPHLIHFNLKTK